MPIRTSSNICSRLAGADSGQALSIHMPIARTLWNRRIKVHDGVEIAADVLLPQADGPFPTVVLRTPYMRGRAQNKGWVRLVDHGYALVTVDIRGRNDSQGEWIPFVKD